MKQIQRNGRNQNAGIIKMRMLGITTVVAMPMANAHCDKEAAH